MLLKKLVRREAKSAKRCKNRNLNIAGDWLARFGLTDLIKARLKRGDGQVLLQTEFLDVIISALVLSVLAVCWVVAVVRVVGLRAFSKMTAFDFVATVAIGSLLAGAIQSTSWSGFLQATIAISGLLGVQYITARVRKSSDRFEAVIQNSPVLLMLDGEILYPALDATRVAEDDLIAKLREANVLEFCEVRAAVLETTRDVSVLHGPKLAEHLLHGVRRID